MATTAVGLRAREGQRIDVKRQLPLALVHGTHEELFRSAGKALPRKVAKAARDIEWLKMAYGNARPSLAGKDLETVRHGFATAISRHSGHKDINAIKALLDRVHA